MNGCPSPATEGSSLPVWRIAEWLEHIDPGTHRRIKGLRLVTAYGIAALLGRLPEFSRGLSNGAWLRFLAAGFALWASVSEARTTRAESSRDLVVLCAAAALGAVSMIVLSPVLSGPGHPGAELTLVSGAFLVGYLRRFGVLGMGVGSQIFIGQLLAYGAQLVNSDLCSIGLAAVIAAVGAVVPRMLSGPAEHPAVAAPIPPLPASVVPPELRMGLQAALGGLVIVVLNDAIGLDQSAWAITACTYVVAGSTAGTIDRVRRRIIGTAIGVPLGIACLPLALHAPPLVWMAAALAMIIYAMALPERYDIACAAYAFTLMVTLAATGEHSLLVLVARAWETLLGAGIGATAALVVLPLRPGQPQA
jgi:Fusaric acid resistance protein-like